jgi:RNA polymerase sigma factor (sigma-70 family)
MNSSTDPGLAATDASRGLRACDESPLTGIRARLVGLAVKLLWNRDDAEEIVQETFALGLQKMIAVHETRSMPWMLRTVSNLAMNRRRKSKACSLNEFVDPAVEDRQDRLEVAERLGQLRERILALPDQQRLALTLKMLEQREYGEIAEIMQISVSAARTHVHLARQSLMRSMGGGE